MHPKERQVRPIQSIKRTREWIYSSIHYWFSPVDKSDLPSSYPSRVERSCDNPRAGGSVDPVPCLTLLRRDQSVAPPGKETRFFGCPVRCYSLDWLSQTLTIYKTSNESRNVRNLSAVPLWFLFFIFGRSIIRLSVIYIFDVQRAVHLNIFL